MDNVRGYRLLQLPPLLLAAALAVSGCGRFGGVSLQDVQDTLSGGDIGAATIQLQNLLEKQPGSADAELLFARVLMLQGDLAGASSVLARAKSSGAAPQTAASLESRLLLEAGRPGELLSRLESGDLALDTRQASLQRARALTVLGQVPEALQILEGLGQSSEGDGLLEVYISQAHAAFGRWELAAQHAERARMAQPELPQAWLQSGLLALQSTNLPDAVAYFDRAEQLAGDELTLTERSLALRTMADIALREDDVATAKGAYGRLVAIAPHSFDSELLEARLLLATGSVVAAIARLETLVQSYPEVPAARLVLASALLSDGRIGRAGQELGQLRSREVVSPAVVQAQAAIETASRTTGSASALALAQAQLLLDQSRAAQTVLEKSLTESSNYRPVEVALVQVLLRRGQVDAAVKRATELVRKAPEDPAAHFVLAQAQLAAKDPAAATAGFEEAWRLEPTSSNAASLALARQSAGLGDPLAPLVEHLSREPRDVQARLLLADLQSRSGRTAESMANYQSVLSIQPRNPVAANNLAGLYLRRGDPRALETAKTAFEVLPDRPETNDTYGWILAESGQVAQAVPLLEKSVRLDPARPVARYHLAAALARRGEPQDKARARLWLADALRDPAEFRERPEAARLLGTMSQTEKD